MTRSVAFQVVKSYEQWKKIPIYRDEATHCYPLLIFSILFSHLFFIKILWWFLIKETNK